MDYVQAVQIQTEAGVLIYNSGTKTYISLRNNQMMKVI